MHDINATDCWLAVLSSTESAVLQSTSNLQHHCRCAHKERCPSRVGDYSHQHLALVQPFSRPVNHANPASSNTWRDCTSHQSPRLTLDNIRLQNPAPRIYKQRADLGLFC